MLKTLKKSLNKLAFPTLSLYVHIPWCVKKCLYCDFNSHVSKSNIPEQKYIIALLEDLDKDIERYQLNQNQYLIHSIFIGGGTPSLMSIESIKKLIIGIKRRIPFKSNIEITIEANPNILEIERFSGYLDSGINRISIGIQSFESKKLKYLGRTHRLEEAVYAASLAKKLNFKNVNLDLMYGLPKQNVEQALSDLDKAIQFHPTHLSWYQLTIEPNTIFYYKKPYLPHDHIYDISQQGHDKLTKSGYTQYEISSYSKINYQCQHNLNYWRFGDYLGIGCGSHGKLTFENGLIIRTIKIRNPRDYLTRLNNKVQLYLSKELKVENKDKPFEFFMNRFRLIEDCPKQDFTDKTKLDIKTIQNPIDWSLMEGYLTETSTHWKLTKKGQLFLNDLLIAFI
ncbi:oxidoreductase [Candidatus Photodesmus katoptron]|uniref:radical SAM family heme chaperone HemW n=1 Tax=Candidatus Photodesmus anomalopis TaxID=28176 RepID=UPI0004D90B8C|nr:radical SAM family heme chaperone HemW [Candidatus Photodesmus katoptron]KEY90086.1 oxidoreductase [Candidatus Photodesmus katoptron]